MPQKPLLVAFIDIELYLAQYFLGANSQDY